jgi:uncharacterized membrane protein YtjA (UPF0391 family)
MLPWWIIVAVIAFIAAGFGFAGVADGAAGTAELYLYVFFVLAALFVVARVRGRRRTSRPAVIRERRTPTESRTGSGLR